MSDIEVLERRRCQQLPSPPPNKLQHTFIPSSEKQGGTAELSSSASLKRIGNFSTADMGMSPL